MSRAIYRSRQVWHALRPRIDRDGIEYAKRLLPEVLRALFDAMETRDRRHAVAVMQRLRESGHNERDLLLAALLHDCGKGDVPVWLRILRVLSPAALRFVSKDGAAGWRGAAYRLAHDARLSAERVAAAGGGDTVVRLIAGRPLAHEEASFRALMAADDAS